jgi:hypothetical protein
MVSVCLLALKQLGWEFCYWWTDIHLFLAKIGYVIVYGLLRPVHVGSPRIMHPWKWILVYGYVPRKQEIQDNRQ